jgi:hypothetical protein
MSRLVRTTAYGVTVLGVLTFVVGGLYVLGFSRTCEIDCADGTVPFGVVSGIGLFVALIGWISVRATRRLR